MNPPDRHYLSAAIGWLGLGNWREANEELDRIRPALRGQPDVLVVRWQVYAKAGQWEACVDLADALTKLMPSQSLGWVHRSFALHELKRTQEAFDRLLPTAHQFPGDWIVSYNLACYCAQLGRLDECKEWFKKAMAIDPEKSARAAIDDPDLKSLWDSMAGTFWRRE